MPDTITGLWAAATTPIVADGTIDHSGLMRHARRRLEIGDQRVLLGSCAEVASFAIAGAAISEALDRFA